MDVAELRLGGSAAIAAAGLARLGVPVSIAAVVGQDNFGRFAVDQLNMAGVDTRMFSTRRSEPTGISIILSASGDRSILTFPGTIPSLSHTVMREAVERLEPQHVHFASYFLQPQLAEWMPALCAELKRRQLFISLDTNWDPSERWYGVETLLRCVDLFLPNRAEALAIASAIENRNVVDLEDAGTVLAALGCHTVIKNGRAGATSYNQTGVSVAARGVDVDVVDTTGAGDSFDAGYIASRLHGVSQEQDRLRWATVAGSLSARGHGGTRTQADLAELTAML
jgi:ribokinase